LHYLYAAGATLFGNVSLHERCEKVATQLFWFLATLQVALSIGFAVIVRRLPQPQLHARDFALARSQRKDNWLTCAIVWIVLLGDRMPAKGLVLTVGALVLAWLSRRTLQRVRLLQRAH